MECVPFAPSIGEPCGSFRPTPEETQGHFHLSAYPGVEYLAPEAACCTRIKGIEHSADTLLVRSELSLRDRGMPELDWKAWGAPSWSGGAGVVGFLSAQLRLHLRISTLSRTSCTD